MTTSPTGPHQQEEEIAERVAEKLGAESPDGRQPMPQTRRWSIVALGVALVLASMLLLVAGLQIGTFWTLVGGVMVALAVFLVVGLPVLGPMLTRMREETSARREAAEEIKREG